MESRRRALFGLAASAALPLLAPAARAQAWPSRPISMIVPASAGGPTDAIGRVLAEAMGARLGQTVLIDNVAGAGGSIGVGKVARVAPDGYTLGIGQWSHYVLNGATYALQYDLLKDFAPIALLANGPLLLVVRKTLPVNNLKELIAWLKANADKASAGTGGIGAPGHISGIFFQKMTDTHFAFVPYRGTAPALRDLMAGQIDLMIDQAFQRRAANPGRHDQAFGRLSAVACRRLPMCRRSTRRACRVPTVGMAWPVGAARECRPTSSPR
jgi:tripartite-type tricarboxylate transporter receptor subunit TctC